MIDEVFQVELVPGGRTNTKDTEININREPNKINKYVNPGSGALWNEQCKAIHVFYRTHKSIVS